MTNARCSYLLVSLALAAALTGCGPADNEPGPGGVTVGEARALDEAAEMLDERKALPAAMPENGPDAQNASDDSSSSENAETR